MTNWLVCPKPRSNPKLRLLCFAYAGGSAWIFRTWAEIFPATVELFAIELPGRGKRMAEPALTAVTAIVEALGPELLPYLDLPFVCFGHSLGALIAFELCRWLQHTVQLIPYHLWVSAAKAPHLPLKGATMHTLPDAAFINEIKRYKGTPDSILNNAEMMNLLLPILRADFTVLETYRHQPGAAISCPITGFWGQQDTIVSKEQVAAWDIHTQDFSLAAIKGNHFFMQQPIFSQRLASKLMHL